MIFESNVILDYINTLIDGKGFPADAVDRAIAKAKMEFASEVQSTLGTLYYRAKTQEVPVWQELRKSTRRLRISSGILRSSLPGSPRPRFWEAPSLP